MPQERARESASPLSGWEAYCAAARGLDAAPGAAAPSARTSSHDENDDASRRR